MAGDPKFEDLSAEEAKEKVSNSRSASVLDKYAEAEKAGKNRETVLAAIEERKAALDGGGDGGQQGGGDASSRGAASGDQGADAPDRPPVLGGITNPDDGDADQKQALEQHDADPQGSAAFDASEVQTVTDQVSQGTHLVRGPDGALHQVSQIWTR